MTRNVELISSGISACFSGAPLAPLCRTAYSSLQNLITYYPDMRCAVAKGFVTLILREVPDNYPQEMEASLKSLAHILGYWRTTVVNENTQNAQKVCVYVCTYTVSCLSVCLSVCVCVCVCVCAVEIVHTCMHACNLHVNVELHTYIHKHAVSMYTHVQGLLLIAYICYRTMMYLNVCTYAHTVRTCMYVCA